MSESMESFLQQNDKFVRLSGGFGSHKIYLKSALIDEAYNKIPQITVEFFYKDLELPLADFVGKTLNLVYENEEGSKQHFKGTCISLETVATVENFAIYSAQVRPWFHFLTLRKNSKVFQEKSVIDIIKEVLDDNGFSGNLTDSTQGTFKKREYCIQFNESDHDFLCRLMEEEGIFFCFDYEPSVEKLVLLNDNSKAQNHAGEMSVEYVDREPGNRAFKEAIFEWISAERVTKGKMTLNDYFLDTPTADQKGTVAVPKGEHSHKNYETYEFPGHHTTQTDGEAFSKTRMHNYSSEHKRMRGLGTVHSLGVGKRLTLSKAPREADNGTYMILSAKHSLTVDPDGELMGKDEDGEKNRIRMSNVLDLGEMDGDLYRCEFEALPAANEYRPPKVTPWPVMPNMMTAVVVGPSGDEIHTDKYGRIKIQFHWDRLGQKNDTSSVFIRTMMPWTGKNWGMIAIPRIGNEVVVQFENGNPDRPVCVGMMYNADNMPPYDLPANMTQSGVKTNSSKGGEGFNELMFEDKKDSELVRFQAEKDYQQIVKNNADITIGLEKMDEGNLTQTIHMHKTETINEGNDTLTVETGDQFLYINTGSQTVEIETDQTETIRGKSDRTVTGDVTETVESGNHVTVVQSGDQEDTIESGNKTETISLGDYSISADAGSISVEAAIEIELKVGSSSIKIDNTGVTIKGMMIAIEGTATAEMKSPMTTVKGDGLLTLKGGMTMIN